MATNRTPILEIRIYVSKINVFGRQKHLLGGHGMWLIPSLDKSSFGG